MAEFSLPANSVVKTGKLFKAAEGVTNIRRFIVYRYDPATGENPSTDTYEVDMDGCGPMVLDALLKIEPATTDAIPSDDKAFFHTTPSPELDLSKHERRIQ